MDLSRWLRLPPGVRLRFEQPLLAALAALALLLALLDPYRGWRVLTVALLGVLLVSLLWTLALARRLTLRREMRFGWAQVGDRLVERFTLENASAWPALWLEVLDHSTLPGYRASRGTGAPARDVIRWHRETWCTRRGLFTLGPTTLRSGDPFGLFTFARTYEQWTTLMVTPPIIPLPQVEIAPGGRSGEGRPRDYAPERTVSAGTVRSYQPGDSYRWIHWKTSAHRDALYVRLFDGTPASDWWILLDLDRRVQVGQEDEATEEYAIMLAASLADRGLREGQRVGLIAYGQSPIWLPPARGEGQRWEILRALALAEPGTLTLAQVLERSAPTLGAYPSLIIITSAAHSAWIEALLPLLRRGVVPTVFLFDPRSFGGEGDPTITARLLAQWGVREVVLERDWLERPRPLEETRRPLGYGRVSHGRRSADWDWRLLGGGA